MKKILFILVLFYFSCNYSQPNFQLQKGDILFQDLDTSPLCDAIEIVTPGYKNGNFSHIAIVTDLEDNYFKSKKNAYVSVLEAVPKKVKITRLDSFLNRSFDVNNNPKVIVGRLKPKYKYLIDDAIIFAKSKLGEKYDNEFLINNNMYYCSELIYEAFANDSIFKLRPMTFLHPITNDTINIWREYYSNINMSIPEKKLGINPGTMSLSKKIDIVHFYGKPEGIQIE